MDRRIDLTENRDFRKRGNDFVFHPSLGNFTFKSPHPWSYTEKWYSTNDNPETSLILTGCKEEREKKKKSYKFTYEYNIHCDKCGKNIKPWDMFYDLCKSCNQEETELIIYENDLPLTRIFKNLLCKKIGINTNTHFIRVDVSNTQWINVEEFDDILIF